MKVAIVKYNAGNIYSVAYALKRLGINPIITADPDELPSLDDSAEEEVKVRAKEMADQKGWKETN